MVQFSLGRHNLIQQYRGHHDCDCQNGSNGRDLWFDEPQPRKMTRLVVVVNIHAAIR